MERNDIFIKIQKAVENVPLMLLGCGSSAPYGLPGMDKLAERLQNTVGTEFETDESWLQIDENLKNGMDLESAMTDIRLNEDVLHAIRRETWELMSECDLMLLQKIVFREIEFPLSDLIKKFNRATAPLNIITTNYDRIVEYACDYAGIGVNTGFGGSYIKRYSDEFRGQGRVNLAKVHGSLDTFRDTHGGSVAIPLLKEIPNGLEPEIITPGISKFEAVLEGTPRKLLTKADSYINNAQGYLCIGYGFNDKQIQENIVNEIQKGKPLVLITKDISEKAAHLLCNNAKHYISVQEGSEPGTTEFCVDKEITIVEGTYWTVKGFMTIID